MSAFTQQTTAALSAAAPRVATRSEKLFKPPSCEQHGIHKGFVTALAHNPAQFVQPPGHTLAQTLNLTHKRRPQYQTATSQSVASDLKCSQGYSHDSRQANLNRKHALGLFSSATQPNAQNGSVNAAFYHQKTNFRPALTTAATTIVPGESFATSSLLSSLSLTSQAPCPAFSGFGTIGKPKQNRESSLFSNCSVTQGAATNDDQFAAPSDDCDETAATKQDEQVTQPITGIHRLAPQIASGNHRSVAGAMPPTLTVAPAHQQQQTQSLTFVQKPLIRHPDSVPKLQNIVATFTLRGARDGQPVELDLRKLALQSRNAEYNPRRFAACIMRIREPKTTALIFSSGKVVCTGAKTEDQSQIAGKLYTKAIKKLGYNLRMHDFKVQNCVASCDTKFSLSLLGLSTSEHARFCQYDPELFPGLIYRLQKPKLVMLIFGSGKIVFTGAKSRDHLQQAFDLIEPVLRQYRRS